MGRLTALYRSSRRTSPIAQRFGQTDGATPMKIAAYIAALRLKKILAERRNENENQPRVQERIADYGDNGTEAQFYLLTDNFR